MDPGQRRHVRGLHVSPNLKKALARPRPSSPVSDYASLPRWISVAGLEFGSDRAGFCNDTLGLLGQDYFLNSRATFDRLAKHGFTTFRIPFRWERLQPILGGPLDPDGVQHLRLQLNLATRVNGQVLLDLHNYGRYTCRVDGKPMGCGLGEELSGQVRVDADHLADFWARMAHAFSGQPALIGYGLMNEPHELPEGAWVEASRKAAEAIRNEGDRTRLYVAGDRWSSSAHWDLNNPQHPWVEDPEGRITYEAHCYLDQDGSGKYQKSFEEELEYDPELRTRSAKRLQPFIDWLTENEAEGILGEFGVPSQDHSWVSLLPSMLATLDQAGVPAVWWAAGERWGDYPLSLQPAFEQGVVAPAEAELFRQS